MGKENYNDSPMEIAGLVIRVLILSFLLGFPLSWGAVKITSSLSLPAFLVANLSLWIFISLFWWFLWLAVSHRFLYAATACAILTGVIVFYFAVMSNQPDYEQYLGKCKWSLEILEQVSLQNTEPAPDPLPSNTFFSSADGGLWYHLLCFILFGILPLIISTILQYLTEQWLKKRTVPFILCILLGLIGVYILGYYIILVATTLGSTGIHFWLRSKEKII